jgi:hypothetical protein
LIVCDEVTFLGISKQDAKVRTQALSRKVVSLLFFLALILSACIITSSLIHEVTTLMEKLFKL